MIMFLFFLGLFASLSIATMGLAALIYVLVKETKNPFEGLIVWSIIMALGTTLTIFMLRAIGG